MCNISLYTFNSEHPWKSSFWENWKGGTVRHFISKFSIACLYEAVYQWNIYDITTIDRNVSHLWRHVQNFLSRSSSHEIYGVKKPSKVQIKTNEILHDLDESMWLYLYLHVEVHINTTNLQQLKYLPLSLISVLRGSIYLLRCTYGLLDNLNNL